MLEKRGWNGSFAEDYIASARSHLDTLNRVVSALAITQDVALVRGG